MCRYQHRESNVLYQQPQWRHIQLYLKPRQDMSGTGILSQIVEYAREYGPKVVEAYSGEMGTKIKNLIPNSDENARPGFPGEKHAILQLPNGRTGIANFMGPGTEVEKRIKRKDPPRTPADAVARAHDLRYALANNVDDLRDADIRMVNKLDKVKDAPMNIFLGKRLIQAKMKAEDMGLLPRNQFKKNFKRNADSAILQDALNKMEQQGYGLKLAGTGPNKRRKKSQTGGFFFALPAIIAAISSAASAAMATGIPTAMATAALTGAAGAAGVAAVNKIVGKGITSKLQQVIRKTKVGLKDLSTAAQKAVKQGYQYMKENPDQVKKIIETLAPHFKHALAEKVKQKLGQSGKGLVLAGKGLDEQIASIAMKNLNV